MENRQTKPDRSGFTERAKDLLFGYSLLLPTFIVFAIVILYPIINGLIMSFSDYTYITVAKGQGFVWNAFANYATIFNSNSNLATFWKQLANTLIYTVSTVGIELVLGMSIALMINSNIRGKGVLRSLFLMPWTIPSIVTALLWGWLFQAQFGTWNYFLKALGLITNGNMEWIQNQNWAMFTVVVASVWRNTPYMIIMLLAALQNVRVDLIEAAYIDGARAGQVFWNVKIPSIRAVLGTTLITCIMSSFQSFTIIFNMTNGGPVDATTTMSIGAYKHAFTNMNLGAGAAVGVIWMVILVTGISIFNIKTKRFDNM